MSSSANGAYLFRSLLGLLVVGFVPGVGVPAERAATTVRAQTPAVQPLSADDVSWLFPAPTQASDFSKLISMSDLMAPSVQDPAKRDPVWSDAAFQQFLGIGRGDQLKDFDGPQHSEMIC